LPAMIGKPIIEISGLIDKSTDPIYSTSIGLMLWNKNKSVAPNNFDFSIGSLNNVVDKVKSAFKHFLP